MTFADCLELCHHFDCVLQTVATSTVGDLLILLAPKVWYMYLLVWCIVIGYFVGGTDVQCKVITRSLIDLIT